MTWREVRPFLVAIVAALIAWRLTACAVDWIAP